MHFFVYDLVDQGVGNGYAMGNLRKYSTSVNGIWDAMNLKESQIVELGQMQDKINRKSKHILDDTPAPLIAVEGAKTEEYVEDSAP